MTIGKSKDATTAGHDDKDADTFVFGRSADEGVRQRGADDLLMGETDHTGDMTKAPSAGDLYLGEQQPLTDEPVAPEGKLGVTQSWAAPPSRAPCMIWLAHRAFKAATPP